MLQTEPQYMSAVVGIYAGHEPAQNAIEQLKRVGFRPDAISLVGSQHDMRLAQEGYFYPPAPAQEGAIRQGARQGAEMGAATGLVVGFATLLIPGLGLIAALGPLAGMLVGAGAGALTGGPLGAIGYQEDAIDYRRLLEDGSLLVIAHCVTKA